MTNQDKSSMPKKINIFSVGSKLFTNFKHEVSLEWELSWLESCKACACLTSTSLVHLLLGICDTLQEADSAMLDEGALVLLPWDKHLA